PLGRHVPPIEEQPGGPVLGEVAGPEIRRQQAEAALAPEVELPEPVPGGVEALRPEGVERRRGADMRQPPAVDADLDRAFEPGDGVGGPAHRATSMRCGPLVASACWNAAMNSGSDSTRRPLTPNPLARLTQSTAGSSRLSMLRAFGPGLRAPT